MKVEENGSSLVEVLGVLAIIAVLAVSVWSLVSSAWSRYRLSQTLAQLQSLQKGINRMYASAGKYDDLATDGIKKLLDNNVPPKDMRAGSNALHHAMGGSVEVAPVFNNSLEGYGKACDSFTITFKNLNKKACAELAAYSWIGNDSANIVSITVKATKYVWPAHEAGEHALPIEQAEAMSLCAESPLDITWEFR